MYANGIIAMPSSMEESRAQRNMIRSVTEGAGRSADEVKFLPFVSFGLGATQEEAVERRMALENAVSRSAWPTCPQYSACASTQRIA